MIVQTFAALSYILFIFYLLVSLVVISHSGMVAKTGVKFLYWRSFFIIKVVAACFYGYWYNTQKGSTSDTWWFYKESLAETSLLKHHPYQFLTNLFNPDYVNSGGLFDAFGFWNDLKSNIIIKLLALINLISNSNYYVNALLYSFITFWGFVLLYRALQQSVKSTPSIITWLVLCFTPSCLFWTSGIHRDGLIILCIGFIFFQITKNNTGTKKQLFVYLKILIAFLLLFLLRNYVALLLIPMLIAWLTNQIFKLSIKKILLKIYALAVIAFFSIPAIQQNIINRKVEFEQLEGNSRLPHLNLLPDGISFITAIPQSIDRVLLRPYIWQTTTSMEKLAALENTFLLFFIGFCFYKKQNHTDAVHVKTVWPVYIFCFSVLLLVGYTVPFAGAIVRYKAIFTMLIAVSASLYSKSYFKYKK